MFRKKKDDVLFRAVKFEISPNEERLAALLQVSGICRKVWNEALLERDEIFDAHMRPIYDALKKAEQREDLQKKDKKELVRYLKYWLKVAYRSYPLPTYVEQQNALTTRIPQNTELQLILRSWIEHVLVELHGSIKSFMKLRKQGDPDARPPRIKDEGFFCDISGRSGFGVDLENGTVRLSTTRIAGYDLVFPIPEYQKTLLYEAAQVKDFTVYRNPRDLEKPGRFWISLAYEIAKPAELPLSADNTVFLAIGASAIGICSSKVDRVIKLARPDKHWIPKITEVKKGMKTCAKGSRKWRGLNAAKQKMFRLMSHQQRQNRRELVQELLKLGIHFVSTDLVIRSKPGKLADASKPERGGQLGLNWSAQNTGSIAYLLQWLEQKAKEKGGTVRRFSPESFPPKSGEKRKIQLARHLRDEFRRS